MKRFVILAAMLAVVGTVNALDQSGGEHNNTNCNGVGNINSPCGGQGGSEGGGGGGGAGGNGGNATVGNVTATGGTAVAFGGSATGGSVTNSGNLNVAEGAVQVTGSTSNGNTLNVAEGAVQNSNTNTANGGARGNAVVAEGAVTVNIDNVGDGSRDLTPPVAITYKEVQQAPAIGQGSFAISGCSVAGNAGASGPGGAGFLGFGWTPAQCYDFMLAQAYQSIGEKKAVCDILKNTKAGKRQAKRGITLPECEPEVVVVPVVTAPAPEPKTVYVEVPPAKISE